MNVLYTDYRNVAVLHACSDIFGDEESRNVWILSRTPILPQMFMEAALRAMRSNEVEHQFLEATQQDCAYTNIF